MSEDRTGQPIDPRVADEALRRYYATTPPSKVIEDVRRFSPELADRLGIGRAAAEGRPRRARAILAAFGRSIHRMFS